MEDELNIGGGLNKLQKDERDLSLGGIFGSMELPPDVDFTVSSPLEIKNQKDSDMCTAYTLAAVSEDQEGVELSPEYIFAKTKYLTGNPLDWGADLRQSCRVLVKFGSLAKSMSPYTLEVNGRDYVADFRNWNETYDALAESHKKASFFNVSRVGDKYDHFDEIRASLWRFRSKNQSVAMGLEWCPEWTYAKDGVINKQGTPQFGHAFKIYGQRMINGEPYLIAQLSNGTRIGDKGIFYISREIINTGEEYGAFMFNDTPAEYAKFLHKKGLTVKSLWMAKLIIKIKSYFSEFFI